MNSDQDMPAIAKNFPQKGFSTNGRIGDDPFYHRREEDVLRDEIEEEAVAGTGSGERFMPKEAWMDRGKN